DPLQRAGGRVEFPSDRRYRDVDDRRVQKCHARAQDDDGHHPSPRRAPEREAYFGRGRQGTARGGLVDESSLLVLRPLGCLTSPRRIRCAGLSHGSYVGELLLANLIRQTFCAAAFHELSAPCGCVCGYRDDGHGSWMAVFAYWFCAQ